MAEDSTEHVQVEMKVNGQLVALAMALPKEFKTGSRGFYANSKVTLPNGKRYQANIMLVEIGSKPNGA